MSGGGYGGQGDPRALLGGSSKPGERRRGSAPLAATGRLLLRQTSLRPQGSQLEQPRCCVVRPRCKEHRSSVSRWPQSMGNVVDAPGAGRAKDRVPRPPSHQPPGSGHVSRGDAARLGLAVTPFAMEPPWGRGQASRGFKRWMPRVTSHDRPCQPPARQERARRRRYQVPVLPVRGGERVSVFTASVYEGPILSLNNTLSSSSSDHDPPSRRGH